MRALVTGASGLLGTEIRIALEEIGFSVVALVRAEFLKETPSGRSDMLSGFDVITHAAANTNVEQCEVDPEKCYFDNCFLTEQLYHHARRNNLRFVFISSTGVYGRHKATPYHEYDTVFPTTIHHRSKYLAERLVMTSEDTLVVRTGWLFGGSFENKKNFVANRIKEIQTASGSIFANTSQFGSPTYARDCARRVVELISDQSAGVYNVVNDGSVSRFEYVKKIVELSGSRVEVLPLDASGFKRLADVSENEAALSYRMRFEGRKAMRSWHDALSDYMCDSGILGA
jgi:dTDP-4-dehydrorhamnose reductase